MPDLGRVAGYAVGSTLLAWVPMMALLNFVLLSQVKPGGSRWRAGAGFFKRDELLPLGQKLLPIYRFMTWAWFGGIGAALLASAIWQFGHRG